MKKLIASLAVSLFCVSVNAQTESPLNDFPPTAILWDAVKTAQEIGTVNDRVTAADANIANNSNNIVAAEAKIALTSNTVVSALAQITTNRANIAVVSNKVDALEGKTNLINTAWQNPASATNWTWTSDGTNITLTGYTGPNDVVIPDMLDGLPVTGFGTIFSESSITSVRGNNITAIAENAFYNCSALVSVIFPNAETAGTLAFNACSSLTTVDAPKLRIFGDYCFEVCTSLASIRLYSVTTLVGQVFDYCVSLSSVIFYGDAPSFSAALYTGIPANQVTNYVTNPTATGWGATFGGMPVVRLSANAQTFVPSTNYVSTGTEPLGTYMWDEASQTAVIVYPNGQLLNVGEETCIAVHNGTASTITNGMVVMYTGSIGNSGNINVAPAYVTATTEPHKIIGMATTDIPADGWGKVTVRGKVRGIPTKEAGTATTFALASEVYVTTNALYAGYVTTNKPPAPFPAIRMAKVIAAHAVNGTYLVNAEYPCRITDLIDVNGTPLTTSGQIMVWDQVRGVFDFNYNFFTSTNLIWNSLSPVVAGIAAQKDPTGFDDPTAVTVSYDKTARTITLTQAGGVDIWWRGSLVTLTSPWTSSAHTDSAGMYYLAMRDSTNVVWSSDVWTFDMAQVAFVNYASAADALGFKETHGLMPWTVHEAEHRTVGCYRKSGLQPIIGTYGIQYDVDSSNTPSFAVGTIKDEDNETSIAQWNEGSYTLLHFTNATYTAVFTTNVASLVHVGTTYPLINTGASTFTETVSARYFNVYQVLIPTTSDSHSQKFRTVFLQPQVAHSSLAAAQAEDFRSLNLGTFTAYGPEFVAFTKITLRTFASYGSTGKMRIESIAYLTGSQASQTTITSLVAPSSADAISVTFTPTNYTASAQNVESHLGGIDSALDTWKKSALNGTNGTYVTFGGTNFWILCY